MKKLKLGIIGYGFMGQWHNNHAGTLEEVEVVAICDTDPAQLNKAPDTASRYSDHKELLKDERVEWVVICVPNHLHCQIAIDAANAKKHLIVEKPCALNVEEFDRMYAAAKENGVMFTVDQNRRWDRDYSMVKKAWEEKRLGNIFMVKSSLYGVFGKMHDWHEYKEYGGGMLYDWGVHLIDQMLDMVDAPIVSLYADLRNVINEKVDDYFNIILKFKNGVTAEIELGTYYLTPKRAWFIGGNTGSAIIDDFECNGKIIRTAHLLENVPGKITMTAAGPTRSFGPPAPGLLKEEKLPEVDVSHRDYFVHFMKAFRGEEELVVKPEQVRRVLAVMEAVRESARTKQAVLFDK